VVLHLRFGTCPPVRLSRAFGSVSNGPEDLIISARSGALARVYIKEPLPFCCFGLLANVVLEWWRNGPRGGASAPQDLSPRFGAPRWRRRFHPLSSEFQRSRSRPPRRGPPCHGGAPSYGGQTDLQALWERQVIFEVSLALQGGTLRCLLRQQN
jgi:hypothetical protein